MNIISMYVCMYKGKGFGIWYSKPKARKELNQHRLLLLRSGWAPSWIQHAALLGACAPGAGIFNY